MPRLLRPLVLLLALGGTLFSRTASAYHTEDERIVDQTAHTLRAREFRLGLWELEFAPLSFATVGTDNVPWVAGLVMSAPAANGHAKVRLLRTRPVTVSLVAAAYYGRLRVSGAREETTGTLWLLPFSLYLSSDVVGPLSVHLGATYTRGDLDGDIDPKIYRTSATVATSALQLHAAAELRANRVVAFVLQGHAQPYASPGVVRSRTTSTAVAGSVDFTGTIEPVDRTAVAATASIVLSGKHMNARFGAGYGAVFLPSMGFVLPYTTVLPGLDLYARF